MIYDFFFFFKKVFSLVNTGNVIVKWYITVAFDSMSVTKFLATDISLRERKFTVTGRTADRSRDIMDNLTQENENSFLSE